MLLPLEICLLLAAAQGICWVLARGLGVRLEGRAVALGLVLPLVFLSPFLNRHTLLAPTGTIAGVLPLHGLPPVRATHLIQSDTLYQFIPWELEIRHALHEHRLPLWSDLLDGGSSPWINPAAGVLSPLAMLARPLPIQDFLLGLLALKMLLACEGAWVLARQLGISPGSRLLVAAGFTLGGGMMSWALFPHTVVLAWVPWLTLGCIRLVRWPRARTLATTAAIAAAMLLSGHPETAAAGGLLAAVCGCGLRRRGRRGGAGFVRGLAAAAAAALLGFALAAPQLLPFLHALPGAQRTRDMLAQTVPRQEARLLEPATWFAAPSAAFVRAPINPRVYGLPYQEPFRGPIDWVDALSGYTGLAAFAGAAVALAAWGPRAGRRLRRALPWLGFVVLSLLLSAGFVPFARLLQAVPALRLPAYTRLLPVACLALAVAGGFGTDLLLRRRLPVGERVRIAAALEIAAVVSLGADSSPYVLLLWGLIAAAALLAPWRREAALALLALALGLDLVPWAQRLLPRGQPALFYPSNALTAALAKETAGDLPVAAEAGSRLPPPQTQAGGGAVGQHGGRREVAEAGGGGTAGAWRAVGVSKLVYPSLLAAYGIADVRPDNVLAPAAYLRVLDAAFGFNPDLTNYYAAFGHPDHPLLSFLGVRAVVGNVWEPRPRTLVQVAAPAALPFLVFRNPRALPRWFVPAAVEAIERPALDRWIATLADPGRVAVFRDELAGAGLDAAGAAGVGSAAAIGSAAAGEPAGAVRAPADLVGGGRGLGPLPVAVVAARALAGAPGRALLAVPGAGVRLLATSILGPAGWRARANGGRLLSELTVDGAFLGVVVPAGVSRVELVYRPPGLVAGTVLGILALLAVLALAVVGRRGHLTKPTARGHRRIPRRA